ncbi:unnamed protein product [Phaeothamnion confervicola]
MNACLTDDDVCFADALRGFSEGHCDLSGAGAIHWMGKMATALQWERAKGTESQFAPYIAALPPPPPLLSMCDADDLTCLQDPDFETRASSLYFFHANLHADVIAAIGDSGGADAPLLSSSNFLSALSLIQSRSYLIEPEELAASGGMMPPFLRDGPRRLLVPLLDMLNHDAGSRTLLRPGPDGTTLQLVAGPVAAGAQVFLNYGPKSNDDLLLYYGFTTRYPNINGADSLCVGPAFTSDDLAFVTNEMDMPSHKVRLLEGIILPRENSFRLGWGGFEDDFIKVLRLFFTTADDLPAGGRWEDAITAGAGAGAADGRGASSSFDAAERRVVEALLRRCRQRLASFPTTLEEDLALLEGSATGGGERGWLQGAALEHRIGKKRLLLDAIGRLKAASVATILPPEGVSSYWSVDGPSSRG